MEVITKFLETMQALLVVKVMLFLAIGLVLALAGLFTRKFWLIGLGLLVAFGQFALPKMQNLSYEQEIEARRKLVRNLPKVPFPADYPRRLIIEGDDFDYMLGWFITAGYFDEVDRRGMRLVAAADQRGCRAAALAYLDPDPAHSDDFGPSNDREARQKLLEKMRSCVTQSSVGEGGSGDATILRLDGAVKYRAIDRRPKPQAIEVSILRAGKETLSHYDEMPTLDYPKSALQLLPEGYEYSCSGFHDLQILVNLIDAAKQPGLAADLMKRGAPGSSKYDRCLVSPAPTRKETEAPS
jgi:hypothetical protein